MKINKMKLRFIIVSAIIGIAHVTKLVESTFFDRAKAQASRNCIVTNYGINGSVALHTFCT